jgi:A/G-specific adenine glycosylase
LLTWYDANRRALPWRKTRNPYRIWISEIMLQQTRVATVILRYKLFLRRFPTIQKLAAARESSVLAEWSGLGYYRRARNLHAAAKIIAQDKEKKFPRTAEALRVLPGIGRYTAAAIASIAFAEPVGVVDGNVERVLERLAGRSLTSKNMWQRAQSLLSKSRPADFNQAMMELGAMVCTPRQPKCGTCPIRKWCATKGEATRTTLPQRQSRKEIWFTLDQRDNRICLVQRPSKASLMAGMWELPQGSPTISEPGKPPATAAKRRKITAHGASRGLAPQNSRAPKGRKKSSIASWQTFRHSITVTDYTVHVTRGSSAATEGKWIAIEEISDVPITGMTRKILKAAGII